MKIDKNMECARKNTNTLDKKKKKTIMIIVDLYINTNRQNHFNKIMGIVPIPMKE